MFSFLLKKLFLPWVIVPAVVILIWFVLLEISDSRGTEEAVTELVKISKGSDPGLKNLIFIRPDTQPDAERLSESYFCRYGCDIYIIPPTETNFIEYYSGKGMTVSFGNAWRSIAASGLTTLSRLYLVESFSENQFETGFRKIVEIPGVYPLLHTLLEKIDKWIPHFGVMEGTLLSPAVFALNFDPALRRPDFSGGKMLYRKDDLQVILDEGFSVVKIHDLTEEPWDEKFFRELWIGVILLVVSFTSEDLTLIAGGVAASVGFVSLVTVLFFCFWGIFIGDLLLFILGKYYGTGIFHNRLMRRTISEEKFNKIQKDLLSNGKWLIFVSRFIPGSRLPIYVIAGAAGMPMSRFVFYFILASFVWTPIPVLLAYFLGESVIRFSKDYNWVLYLLLIPFFIYFFRQNLMSLTRYKTRRMLWASVQRRLRWEFWPSWLAYVPVVPYIFWRCLKSGSLSLFTVVNPGIPASGLKNESKTDIMRKLPAENVGRFLALPVSEDVDSRVISAREFMNGSGLTYPVIFKPDKGERGKNIIRIHNEQELDAALVTMTEDSILQEYFDGVEFGVMYIRYPDQESGFIYSLCEKKMLWIIGDGKSTLEELILRDSRAYLLAHVHLEKWKSELQRVPAADESIQLVTIGTHSKGSVFTEASSLITKEMERAFDVMLAGFEGFYLGRFDVRTPSVEDLQAGVNIRVMELNGLTGEPANMYDPGNSMLTSYRILLGVWKHALNIAEQNMRNGSTPIRISDILNQIK